MKFNTFESKNREVRDRQLAQAFFDENLNGERLIEIPQDPKCEIVVVVPSKCESPQRITELLSSVASQQIDDPEKFELILVVNNTADGRSPEYLDDFSENQAVLALPIWKNGINQEIPADASEETRRQYEALKKLNIFIIDKSSPDRIFPECHVGAARNRGVAEAAQRFLQNQKDGLILQIDSDAVLADPLYFQKMQEIFSDSDVIAAAGRPYYEFSPDDPNWKLWPKDKIRKEWEYLVMMKVSKNLSQWLQRQPEETGEERPKVDFSGTNMMSRSFETAVAKGIGVVDIEKTDSRKAGEDTQFGRLLLEYAAERGKVMDVRAAMQLATALRETGRTSVPLKKYSGRTNQGEPLVQEFYKSTPIQLLKLYTDLKLRVLSSEKGRAYFEPVMQDLPQKYRIPTGENNFDFLK